MRINQNIAAFNSYRNLSATNIQLGKSLEKLSSGFRINRAADDAAGLAKSESLRAEINGSRQAIRNAQDGVSLVQTAEGALNEVHAILQRMRELAVDAANTATTTGAAQQAEVTQLLAEINAIGTNTKFAGQSVFTASARTFHVGAGADQVLSVTVGTLTTGGLTIDSVNLQTGANAAIGAVDGAIGAVSTLRSTLGATQNRLEHTVANLSVAVENLSASESRVRDTDMAAEMVSFTRHQIMVQAGTAMLAQANQVPASVLNLLA
ncbi:MAG: flagellin [Acidimicrobiia bacterium]|nr:flagellin [Acidimicrobiia bacterium]